MKQFIDASLLFMVLVITMGVNECSQQANMNMRSLRNFFGAPFMALGDWASDNTQSAINETYNNMRNGQQLSEPNLSPTFFASFCRRPSLTNANQQQLETLTAWLLNSYCACSPWQQAAACTPNPTCCSSTNCPPSVRCQKICPNDLTLFQRNRENAPPVDGSGTYFSFVNTAFDQFVNDVRPVPRGDITASVPSTAYNLGMISARRKFNELAFFGQGTEPTFENDAARVRYYRSAIDKIFDNKVADFPGYANLSELSRDPMVQEYLTQKIAAEWLDRTMYRSLGEFQVDPERTMNTERANNLVTQAEQGIADFGSSTITFGFADAGQEREQSAQALEAYKSFVDGTTRVLCVVDPNYPIGSDTVVGGQAAGRSYHSAFSEPPPECTPSIRVNQDGTTTYATKRRENHNPPISVIDEDGIPVLRSYTDHDVSRPLYDVSVQQVEDRRDAMLAHSDLKARCLGQHGCNNED